MNREQLLQLIKSLSHSQGFYGRLLYNLEQLEEESPEEYEKLMSTWESKDFKEPIDFILYLEE